jgi:hypothetical protein
MAPLFCTFCNQHNCFATLSPWHALIVLPCVSRYQTCQIIAAVIQAHHQHHTLLEEIATPQGPCLILLPPGQTFRRRSSLNAQPRPLWVIVLTPYLQVNDKALVA